MANFFYFAKRTALQYEQCITWSTRPSIATSYLLLLTLPLGSIVVSNCTRAIPISFAIIVSSTAAIAVFSFDNFDTPSQPFGQFTASFLFVLCNLEKDFIFANSVIVSNLIDSFFALK